jgi:polysaccharide biosynthesis protein PslG
MSRRSSALILAVVLLALAGAAWAESRPRLRYGVHTLNPGPETLAAARNGRFDTVVQLFSWREIEPTEGEFHWENPDQIVAGAKYYGLDLVVRLDQHPVWASPAPTSLNAPPTDPASYARFVRAVASRYRGRVLAYVIWNEPNLATDWGGKPPDPAGYVALLRAGYAAVKEADPHALVVSAGLASTDERSATAMDDRAFLQAMYDHGAKDYFDVLGAHPYGFGHPPDDPRGAHDGLNMARLADLREIMVRHGEERKPVWATEMGWTTHPTDGGSSQAVTPEEQAAYLAQAESLAPRLWPWLGLLAVWNLDGADSPEWGGYSLLDAGGQPGPAYRALRQLPRPWRLPDSSQVAAAVAHFIDRWRSPGPITALAPDAVIHLGDSDYSQPWMPLYGNRNPSTAWEGVFYVPDAALAAGNSGPAMQNDCGRDGDRCWRLSLRLMQSNAWGNDIWINGHRLDPSLPEGDFTNSWFTVTLHVPPGMLQPGPNQLRLTISRAVPLLEDRGFTWDDLQIKDVVLLR